MEGNNVLETVEMAVTDALKSRRPGRRIKGLMVWVDTHHGKLRLKPVAIDLVKATEGLSYNLPNWARYNEWARLKAARDIHFGEGLWVFEDEEFWTSAVIGSQSTLNRLSAIRVLKPGQCSNDA